MHLTGRDVKFTYTHVVYTCFPLLSQQAESILMRFSKLLEFVLLSTLTCMFPPCCFTHGSQFEETEASLTLNPSGASAATFQWTQGCQRHQQRENSISPHIKLYNLRSIKSSISAERCKPKIAATREAEAGGF